MTLVEVEGIGGTLINQLWIQTRMRNERNKKKSNIKEIDEAW